MLTTGDIQTLFRVSPQTVRNWAREFEQYLSDDATPDEKGGKRIFTTDDLAVFALVAEKSRKGITYDGIRTILATGERGTAPEIEIDDDFELTSMMSPREIALTMSLKEDRDKAVAQIEILEAQLDKERENSRKVTSELRDEMNKLSEQIGELKYRLKLLKNDD